MYPFGEHHLCYSDADQYYGFYGYLLSTFFTKNNLFYSWSMALGNGMMSTYAYYASSPLNLLLVFFRNDLMLVLCAHRIHGLLCMECLLA